MLIVILLIGAMNVGMSYCCGETAVKCPPEPCAVNNATVMVCCNIKSLTYLERVFRPAQLKKIRQVYIQNASLNFLNASLGIWRNVQTVTVRNSSVKRLVGQFRGHVNCVNMSAVHLQSIDNVTFSNLTLANLDLSHNNLTVAPNLNIDPQKSLTLDISGNPNISCSSLIANFHERLNFTNMNSTFCLSTLFFDWFNSTAVLPLNQVIMLKQLERNCPKTDKYDCRCTPHRVEFHPGRFPINQVKVDCSGLNLTELPPQLPPNTHVLNVTNNNIKSIDILGIEESYRDIKQFHADNNEIISISGLEGSHFIQNFAVLSLRRNKLTSIPTYFLTNALNDASSLNIGRIVKLGGNILNCDCSTVQELKVWLMKNKASITDYEEVLCTDSKKVVSLKVHDLCVVGKDWMDYISYIIALEILLLVLLISKVSYDYWVFKTKGYLPWPASKMPKLPCDWVCE